MEYDGKGRATSRTSLTVDEMNAGPTNKINEKAKKDSTRQPDYPVSGNKGTGVQEKSAKDALSLDAGEQDRYLKSGELAFPGNSSLYDYLARDEGSDEEKDLDQGYDAVEKPRDYTVDYSPGGRKY